MLRSAGHALRLGARRCFLGSASSSRRVLSLPAGVQPRRGVQSLCAALEAEAAEFQAHDEENTAQNLQWLREQLSEAMEVTEGEASVEIRYAPPAGVGAAGEVITVRFHCQDTAEMPEGKNVDDSVGAPVDFNVLIEFDGLARSLSLDCQGWNDSITIKEMHCYDEGTDPDMAYHGPVFHELDEAVKAGVLEYLDERLLGPEFGTWITKFAYYKEMENYGEWLQKVRSVVG